MFFGSMLELGPIPFKARLSRSPGLELTNLIKHPVISQIENGWGALIGSMNGLICFLYGSSRHGLMLLSFTFGTLLSPPSYLSHHFHWAPIDHITVLGLIRNLMITKLSKLASLSRAPNKVVRGGVYSMRKGSWKLISLQTFPSHITIPEGRNSQVCVDDHLHWHCVHPKEETIVAFDLVAETFHEIPLPETLLDFKVFNRPFNYLGALGGKLCVMSHVFFGSCDVWVMEEYGVAESWVKHHAFSQFSWEIIPYGFTSHGDFLFQVGNDRDRFGLYDPVAAKIKTFKIMSTNSSKKKFLEYVDGLVWIAPSNVTSK